MRTCNECDDGSAGFCARSTKCKDCVKARVRLYRIANLEKVRAYDRERAKTDPKRRAKVLAALAHLKATKPMARAAHVKVGNAVRDGRLVRRACETCGEPNTVAHHDDYLKPLEARWLCSPCHASWHVANGPGKNAGDATRGGDAAMP